MDEEILIPITMFLSIFGIMYVYYTTRNKERLAMIEKGADPEIFKSQNSFKGTSIKLGMFLVGIALGILMGNILDSYTTIIEEVAYFSMIFLFSGASLIIYYLAIEKKSEN